MPRPGPALPDSPLTHLPPGPARSAPTHRRLSPSRPPHILALPAPGSTHTTGPDVDVDVDVDDADADADALPEVHRGLLKFTSTSLPSPAAGGAIHGSPTGRQLLKPDTRKRSASSAGRKALGERSPNTLPLPAGALALSSRTTRALQVALSDTPDAVFTITTSRPSHPPRQPGAPQRSSKGKGRPPLPLHATSTEPYAGAYPGQRKPVLSNPLTLNVPAGRAPPNPTPQPQPQPPAPAPHKPKPAEQTEPHPSLARPSRPATRVFSPSPPPAVSLALLGQHATQAAVGFPYVPAPPAPAPAPGHAQLPAASAAGRARASTQPEWAAEQTHEAEVPTVRILLRPVPPTPHALPSPAPHAQAQPQPQPHGKVKAKHFRHARKPAPPLDLGLDGDGDGDWQGVPPSPPRPLPVHVRRPPTPHPSAASMLGALERGEEAPQRPEAPPARNRQCVMDILAAYLLPANYALPAPATATAPAPGPFPAQHQHQRQPTHAHARTASTLSSAPASATAAMLSRASGAGGTSCPWPAAAFLSALVCWAWEALFRPRAAPHTQQQRKKEAPLPAAVSVSVSAAERGEGTKHAQGQQAPPRPRWPEGATLTADLALARERAQPCPHPQREPRHATDLERAWGSPASSRASFASELKTRRFALDCDETDAEEAQAGSGPRAWREHRDPLAEADTPLHEQEGRWGVWGAVSSAFRAVGGWTWAWGRTGPKATERARGASAV